jgi:pyruvate/2-oxoglutarate dehydrogenase complex dihydrolipoamide dehydrogenase (E3) component
MTIAKWKHTQAAPILVKPKPAAAKVVSFKTAIIAAGSQAVHLPFMPQDPRVVDSARARWP